MATVLINNVKFLFLITPPTPPHTHTLYTTCIADNNIISTPQL